MELGKVYCDRVFAITSFPRAQLHQGRDLIGKLRPRGHMRRTILTIAILGIVWIGYIAWPIYDLFVMLRAVEARDIDTVTRRIDFNRVRISLADQIVHAYMRRTGIQPSPLASNVARGALGIADPIAQKLISPEALSQLITTGWPPATVAPDGPPPGTVGITTHTIGTVWQIFHNSEYGLGRFEVVGPAALPPQHRFRLEFRLLQWNWRLVGVVLPENIQNLLLDELLKATRQ